MAQIQTGTASVVNGDETVIASAGNDWSDAQIALSFGTPVLFSVQGDTEVPYQVVTCTPPNLSASGFWELELTSAYLGLTQTAVPYIIHKDFTNNLQLPIISPGDTQTAQLQARMVEILDTLNTFGTLPISTLGTPQLVSVDTVLPGGRTLIVADSFEVPLGVSFELAVDATLEVT